MSAPNSSAKAMRTGGSMAIGLIPPDLSNPFFPELAQSVEITAREYGFAVVAGNDILSPSAPSAL